MGIYYLIIASFFIFGCSSAMKIQRQISTSDIDSSQYKFHGKMSVLTGDDTGKVNEVESKNIELCALDIIAKKSIFENNLNCFEYIVRSTLWAEEIVLKTKRNSKTGQCDFYATSSSLKDSSDPKIFFIKFSLELDDRSNPKKFSQSISYGFSGIAKICSFEE